MRRRLGDPNAQRSPVPRYGVAVLTTALALLTGLALAWVTADARLLLLPPLAAVAFVAAHDGIGAALIALGVAVAGAAVLLLLPVAWATPAGLDVTWLIPSAAAAAAAAVPGYAISRARRQVESRARHAEQREQCIMEVIGRIGDAVYAVDATFHLTTVNAQAEQRLGGASEVRGRELWGVLPALAGEPQRALIRAMEERVAVEFETFDAATQRWFREKAYPTAEGGLAIHSQDITEYRQVRETLRTSEDQVASMFAAASAGMALIDLATRRFLRVNPALCAMSGYSESELLGLSVDELTHPRDRERDLLRFERLLRGEGGYEIEKRYLRKDGRTIWVRVTGIPTRDPDGRPVQAFAVVEDITARRESEEAVRRGTRLEEYRAALADALRGLADPVEIQSEAARVLGAHLRVSRCYYGEVQGEGEFHVVHRDYRSDGLASMTGRHRLDEFGPPLATQLSEGRIVAVSDTQTDPSLDDRARAAYAVHGVHAFIGVPLVKAGQLVALFAVAQAWPREWTAAEIASVEDTADRTWSAVERARAADAVRLHTAQFEMLVDHAPIGVFLVDADFLIAHVNPAALPMFGELPGGVVGRDVDEVLHLLWEKSYADVLVRTFRRTLETGESYATPERAEFRIDRQAIEHYEWRLDRLLFPDGRHGLVCYVRDVSRQAESRKLFEQTVDALRESEERFRLVVESAEDFAIITLDVLGVITGWNAGATRLLGFSEAEALGEDGSLVFTPEDILRGAPAAEVTTALAEGRAAGERWHVRKDGSRFWGSNLMMPLKHGGENARGLIKMLRDRTEARLAEERLRDSEEQIRRAIHEAPVPIVVHADDGEILQVNEAWTALTGYAIEDAPILKEWLAHAYGRANGNGARLAVQRILENDGTSLAPVELTIATRFGETRHWRYSAATPGVLRDGRHFLVGVAQDITDQRHAEEALRRNLIRERTYLDNLPVGVWFLDEVGRISYGNVAGKQIWADAKFAGMEEFGEYVAWWHGTNRRVEPDERAAARVMHGETSLNEEIDIECLDGSRKTLLNSAVPVRDADGTVTGAIVLNQDITERKRAEEALRESEEWLRIATQAGKVGLWEWDIARNQVTWTDSLYVLHGVTPHDFTPTIEGFIALLHPEDRGLVSSSLQHSLETGTPYELTIRAIHPTGRVIWLYTNAIVVRSEEGPVRMFGATTDVTKLKMAEQALRDADRRKDEFLATLAHELRNPLAPVRSSIQILRMAGAEAGARARVVDVLERQVNHMVRLVDDLLEVSRITRGMIELRQERVELDQVVRSAVETVTPFIEAAGHQLSINLPADPLALEGDPMRLAQVVANLLNNAAKYTPDGGQIWLTARREGDAAVVAVRDTGTGIPPEMLPRIFDLFTQGDRSLTRAQGGLGIGLTLVKRLVELHGGTVEARSEGPGKGAEFIVRLPLYSGVDLAGQVPRQPGVAGAPVNTPASGAMRVLVVDDNRDAAESLAVLLRLHGHEVRTAQDGPEAIESAAALHPDAILLDIGLPEMNGYDVARAIREQPWGRRLVLVAVTGWGQEEDRRRSREAGFDAHLVKPVDPVALVGVLDSLRRRGSARRADLVMH